MNMKKLYFLNEEESTRILNLHKESTKRQYLTEASVSVNTADNSITLTADLNAEGVSGNDNPDKNSLQIKTGTKFTIKDSDNLISQNVRYTIFGSGKPTEPPSPIRYNCKSKFMKIVNRDMSFKINNWDSETKSAFTNLCRVSADAWAKKAGEDAEKASVPVRDPNYEQNDMESMEKLGKFPCLTEKNRLSIRQDKVTGRNYYISDTFRYWGDGTKQSRDIQLRDDGSPTNDGWVDFTCQKEFPNGVGGKSTSTYKKPSIVPALNREIQTSIGVATPTGKLTNADYDAILAKLQ